MRGEEEHRPGCDAGPVPTAGPGAGHIPPPTAWLVTTSLVKSMPSGSGICTPFLVLSVGKGGVVKLGAAAPCSLPGGVQAVPVPYR